MHTVEQAKELWCPMVRHEGDNGGSFNRGSLNNNPTNRDSADSKTPIYGCQCIGDQCAMWRWGEYKADGQRAIVDDPSLGFGGKREVTKDVYIGIRGHCGLAPLQKN